MALVFTAVANNIMQSKVIHKGLINNNKCLQWTVPAKSKPTLISRGGGCNRRRLHLQSRVCKLHTNQVIFSDFFYQKDK